MSGRRRPPSRLPNNRPADDLTPAELAARRTAFRVRIAEARARARAAIAAAEVRLPPVWLPEDDEEPERLGDVAQRLVDGLATTGPAMSVDQALAMLEAFDRPRH